MTMDCHKPLDLAAVRERLSRAGGPQYWRCLEELALDDGFEEFVHREFPRHASEWTNPVTRRQFLLLMGASLALAGLGGCARPPSEKIMPYVHQPEGLVPGKPLFYATAMTLGGFALGLLVESHEGRPTKVEGNPDHPASLGATDVYAQASVLGLYDPDRSQTVRDHLGRIRSWDDAALTLRAAVAKQRDKKGAGLRLLTETVTSPTLAGQLQALLKEFPEAKWVQYEPAGRDTVRAGSLLAFGSDVNTYYRLDKAQRILALDADFLACGGANVRYTRDFTDGRRVREGRTEMNRLYAIESSPTLTGAKADHRFPVRYHEVEGFARILALQLGIRAQGVAVTGIGLPTIAALADDLKKHAGASVVIAGEYQTPAVHALAHAMNAALGNVGKTVIHTDPVEANPSDQTAELRRLVDDMKAGTVEVLVILGGNPVYTAPADLEFGEHFRKVPLRVHLGLYDDETSQLCHWHLPETHYLEAWSDARAYDGTATIMQPLIAPLYKGARSAHELVSILAEPSERTGHEIVKDLWRRRQPSGSGGFDAFWQRSLHAGVVEGTALAPKAVSLKNDWARNLPQPKEAGQLDLVFRPDPAVYDGRFANNAWLQEWPKPLTKLTWDNAALMSPNTAEELGVSYQIGNRGGEHGEAYADVVTLELDGRRVDAPIWIVPGHPDRSITVHLGYGRTSAGKVGSGMPDKPVGFNAYRLRTAAAPWYGTGLKVTKAGGPRYPLACLQQHHSMEGRNLVRQATRDEFLKHPHFAQQGHANGHRQTPLTLLPPHDYPRYKWGMAIDLTSCTGCGACVVACQAENNIPVVGKDEVLRGREMHWLRIDRYYKGNPKESATIEALFQPVACMHCENAPCEIVCPVAATVHSHDGLNDMVYNRCVGTRYCSNNCPYKVRRFNFLQYSDYATANLKLLRNPEVTVRSRGVMEKCTYCVQRIRNTEIEVEKRALRPGVPELEKRILDSEVKTACQQACPASAILFGDLNGRDRDGNRSQVARLRDDPRSYGLLTELNTEPRTMYLAALRNPNPELEAAR